MTHPGVGGVGSGVGSRAALLIAAALAVFGLSGLPAPSEAAFPVAANGKLVYDCGEEQAGILDLCAINADGTGRVNLTNTAAGPGEFHPGFSPDGRRIAYSSNAGGIAGLELINADGTGRVPLGSPTADDHFFPTDPDFSPDGRQVFYGRGSLDTGDLFAINLDGTGEVNLTNGASGSQPTTSPDGRTIAFTRYVTHPCGPPPGTCSGPHIFSMPVGGTSPISLSLPADPESENAPAFGPDGRIVFVRAAEGEREVWAMNPDGSGRTRLTDTPGVDESDPAPSPDGRLIAYERDGEGIWLMNADGSGQHPISSTPAPAGYQEEENPAWQPLHRCAGRLVTIVGDDGPDTLRGTKRVDVIMGFGGKDKIKGRGGKDRICGGAGKDRIKGGGGADRILGEAGKDRIGGGKGKDRCAGGPGRDAGSCEKGKI